MRRRSRPAGRCRPRRGAGWRASWRSRNARSLICSGGSMLEWLEAYLRYLRFNRSASAHTVRAYHSDLRQFLEHVAAAAGVRPAVLAAPQLDRAALRSFPRSLRREGAIEDDPGALVPAPKREVRMPAHLSEREMEALLAAPAA